jgi:hypothetical protein
MYLKYWKMWTFDQCFVRGGGVGHWQGRCIALNAILNWKESGKLGRQLDIHVLSNWWSLFISWHQLGRHTIYMSYQIDGPCSLANISLQYKFI